MSRFIASFFAWQAARRARRRRDEAIVLIGIAFICIVCFAMTCVCGMVDHTLREVGVLPTRTPTPPWPPKPVRPDRLDDARVSPSSLGKFFSQATKPKSELQFWPSGNNLPSQI
ncbi:MAG: hypothetical protein GVY30_08885 [Chloroflexi bacterium]|jgi:hypothetical protein|nr:hypothetical protein [Chloroflexota bacterium]